MVFIKGHPDYRTKESIDKIRKSSILRWKNPEYRRKITDAIRISIPERSKKMSKIMKGRKISA